MRLLVISQHIGYTAPGKVFEALLSELCKMALVDVMTCHYKPIKDILGVNKIIEIKEPTLINERYTVYTDRLFYLCFGIAWRDWMMGMKALQPKEKYDAILALGSSNNLAPLQLGRILHRKIGAPLLVYLVDACPVPKWWNPPISAGGIGRFLKRISKDFSYFASSNPQMLQYQKQFLSKDIKTFDVLYTSSLQQQQTFPEVSENPVFIYLGSLYGLRTPSHLIKAFRLFVKEYPAARLIFVGTNFTVMNSVPDEIRSNIEVKPFTNNPEKYFRLGTAFIDIDAETDNDIFLSSKFTNYVFINRPIICETGKGSPVRNLASSMDSIFLCGHSSLDIYKAMKQCLNTTYDFRERKNLQKLFSPKYNADRIIAAVISLNT